MRSFRLVISNLITLSIRKTAESENTTLCIKVVNSYYVSLVANNRELQLLLLPPLGARQIVTKQSYCWTDHHNPDRQTDCHQAGGHRPVQDRLQPVRWKDRHPVDQTDRNEISTNLAKRGVVRSGKYLKTRQLHANGRSSRKIPIDDSCDGIECTWGYTKERGRVRWGESYPHGRRRRPKKSSMKILDESELNLGRELAKIMNCNTLLSAFFQNMDDCFRIGQPWDRTYRNTNGRTVALPELSCRERKECKPKPRKEIAAPVPWPLSFEKRKDEFLTTREQVLPINPCCVTRNKRIASRRFFGESHAVKISPLSRVCPSSRSYEFHFGSLEYLNDTVRIALGAWRGAGGIRGCSGHQWSMPELNSGPRRGHKCPVHFVSKLGTLDWMVLATK